MSGGHSQLEILMLKADWTLRVLVQFRQMNCVKRLNGHGKKSYHLISLREKVISRRLNSIKLI